MSRVWLARHRELAIPIILKTLREGEAEETAFTQLRNEARLMARIPSPRVVRAVDLGVHEGCPYLAQEYVDGLDLAELDEVRRRALGRGLPLWYVCAVVRDVAEALHSAHQTGVLHRDVKPSNLFGAPQSGIRLGDFGIATTRSLQSVASSGTLSFIAPEALRGYAPTRRCDVYSLGATAFDLYYGRTPFTELREILEGVPLSFPRAANAQEAYFQHVLSRMLEREPERRFSSVTAPMRLLGSLAASLHPQLRASSPSHGVYQLGPVRIECSMGDIADAQVDGIVSAAIDEMRMRHGVSDALRSRGGQEIEDEAMKGGKRALGQCVATTAGMLSCRYVLHAVSAWNEVSCIARTSQRTLLLAEELGLKTLAIPALGTGVAKVPPEACAYAVASALYSHVLLGGSRLREVRFVLFDKTTLDIFIESLDGLLLGESDDTEREDALPRLTDLALDQTHFIR